MSPAQDSAVGAGGAVRASGGLPAGLTLQLAQQPEADALLSADPFALLVGMLLDQQFPMEKAFAGPWLLAQRLGTTGLDPAVVSSMEPERFAGLMAGPPAVHRYHRSMAGRVQALAAFVCERHGGRTELIWRGVSTAEELKARLLELPGFGDQKARIFVALLGKQVGVRPSGWRAAAGGYGEDGVHRSVADVVDQVSLQQVRDYKKAAKASAVAERATISS